MYYKTVGAAIDQLTAVRLRLTAPQCMWLRYTYIRIHIYKYIYNSKKRGDYNLTNLGQDIFFV